MRNYKYISEPKKPLFPVGKAIIALLIILFNFWSFDVFSASISGYIYECSRDSDGFGIEPDLSSTPEKKYLYTKGSGSAYIKSTTHRALYKFSDFVTHYNGISTACLLTDEPEPDVLCHDGYPNSPNSITLTGYEDLPVKSIDDVNYFAYEGCGYNVAPIANVEKDWSGTCYNFNLVRSDVSIISEVTSSNVESSLLSYKCVENSPLVCGSGQHEENGVCVNDSPLQCPSGQHEENGVCVNDPPLQCPSGQHEENGVCVNDPPLQCPSGQHEENGVCVANSNNSFLDTEVFSMHLCTVYSPSGQSNCTSAATTFVGFNAVKAFARSVEYYNGDVVGVESSTSSGLTTYLLRIDVSSTHKKSVYLYVTSSADYSGGDNSGDDNSGGQGFDMTEVINTLNSSTVTLGQKLDTQTTTIGLKFDTLNNSLGQKLDNTTNTLGQKLDNTTNKLGQKLDNTTNTLGQKLDSIGQKIDDSSINSLGDNVTYNLNNPSLSSVFDSNSVSELNSSNNDLETAIEAKANEVKAELLASFQITSVSADFNESNLDLGKWGQHDTSLNRFSDTFPLARSVVLFLASVASLFIVMFGIPS